MSDQATATPAAHRQPFCVFFDAGCPVCAYRASGATRAAVSVAARDHVALAHPDGTSDAHWPIGENQLFRRQPGGVHE